MLGDGIKRPTPSELSNISGVRRGVVAATELKRDCALRKRPRFQKTICWRDPAEDSNIVGRKLKREMKVEEPIKWDDLE